jgi:invasion protein IalB
MDFSMHNQTSNIWTNIMLNSSAVSAQPWGHGFFDPANWTVTCVVHAPESKVCAVIDSVLDDEPKSGRTSTATADEAGFVRMRGTRDATLAMPGLILSAVQINIRAGQLPAPENNGVAYLKIPLNAL